MAGDSMRKNRLLALMWMIVFGVIFLPVAAFAGTINKDAEHEKTWKAFNTAVDEKTTEIKALVFGPITKILGVLGIAYGIFSMLMSGSPKPLLTYGGIGLLLSIIPHFIDTIFGGILPRL
jgi:hypothetical protein